MKNLIIFFLIFLTIPLVNAQEKPPKEKVIQSRATLDGWCQTIKSLRTF